ncbi:hypothetical protein N473_17860 [Pseudoalteromonas luteoviolacea CPMOR-1]|uniref:Uncharacterized protein n=1 Tax=Pseudoalteromonas luteoviolacea CPMOR-1 TaxID=1365248 RepID=A0A167KUK2_9GAMM|nr:hypothetical protein N473_17860 [Pseudoalteromonas luteoviolacea CPMOR-1]
MKELSSYEVQEVAGGDVIDRFLDGVSNGLPWDQALIEALFPNPF